MKIYLNVPLSRKEEVKRNGAKWDPIKKQWYIEDRIFLKPFLKYMPKHLLKPCKPVKK